MLNRVQQFIAAKLRRPTVLVAVLTLVVMGLIWGSIGATVLFDRKRMFEIARVNLQDMQKVMSAHVLRAFEAAEARLVGANAWLALASRQSPRPGVEELADVLDRMRSNPTGVQDIRLVDGGGKFLRFGQWGELGTDVSDREWFIDARAALAGALRVGASVKARDTGIEIIPIAMRASPNAYGVEVISSTIRIDRMRQAFAGTLGASTNDAGIMRRDGLVLFHTTDIPNFVGSRYPGFDYTRFLTEDGASVLFEHRGLLYGKPRLSAATAFAQVPMVVYTTLLVDELYAKWWSGAREILVQGGIASAVVLALSAWILVLLRRNDRHAAKVARALSEVQAASSAKTDFMAKMSHELRTPMNAILGFSELMGNPRFVASPARQSEYARDIHGSGRHLLSLIDQILDIARLESGDVVREDTTICLPELLQECVDGIKPLAEGRHLQVSLSVAPGAQALRADRQQVRQMVLNLLSNAVKFNRQGGQIVVQAARTEGGLSIAVADTGQGVPEAIRPHLFEPFGRGSALVATKPAEGLGLGLPIAKALIDQHQGSIAIADSDLGGTVVTLPFPPDRVPSNPVELAA